MLHRRAAEMSPAQSPAIESSVERLAVHLTSLGRQFFLAGFAGCSPGDGATTIVRAVAARLHHGLGRRVLVIDANFRTPNLHVLFGRAAGPGLSELLAGQCTLREAVQGLGEDGPCLIGTGASPREPLWATAGDAIEAMKIHLHEYFDIVLFDCAPLASHAGTFVLAQRLDGLVLVLAAERTRWQNGIQIMQQLKMQNVNVVGAALNGKRYYLPRFLYRVL